jgi:phenylalanyl-tRNA synthetase beta chain
MSPLGKRLSSRLKVPFYQSVSLKKVTIKGYQSEGMICSLNELGVPSELLTPDDVAGIHVLDKDAPVGNRDVLKYLGLDDTIFDIRPLANP